MSDTDFDGEGVRSGAEFSPFEVATPTDYTRATTKASSMREMSMTQLGVFLDKTDTTIRKWVDTEDCPYIQRADKKLGKAWVFDSAAVVKWYSDRAAKLAVERVGVAEDGVISADEAKRRRWVALAISSEIDTGEKLKEFVRVPVALARMSSDYSKVRISLQAIPNAVAGQVPPQHRDLVKTKITAAISVALDALKVGDPSEIDGDGEDQ
ncbi:terminase small subunit [Agrobacterium sp. SHOUNA12C]|nr:terminase small subunit [Agrobacterium sp. BETTINA12B]MCJ9757021.1 terminase small subunit [Agrobacterium sp. SHOUNA12C]